MNRETTLRPEQGGKLHAPVVGVIPERWELEVGDAVRIAHYPRANGDAIRAYTCGVVARPAAMEEPPHLDCPDLRFYFIQMKTPGGGWAYCWLPRECLRLIPPPPKMPSWMMIQELVKALEAGNYKAKPTEFSISGFSISESAPQPLTISGPQGTQKSTMLADAEAAIAAEGQKLIDDALKMDAEVQRLFGVRREVVRAQQAKLTVTKSRPNTSGWDIGMMEKVWRK